MSLASYDFAVIGCGGIGSASAYWLSRVAPAGSMIVALEQFELGHHRGGSQDHSRIIRLSYYPEYYTKLAPYMYQAWAAVELESGVQLVYRTGCLEVGPADSKGVEDTAQAMDAAGIVYEELSPKETMARFPQFRIGTDYRVLFQCDSGFVDARKANAVHISLAKKHGVTVMENCPVNDILPQGEVVRITTDKGSLLAKKVIVTSGAWTNKVLKEAGVALPLVVSKEQVNYYQCPDIKEFLPDRFPVWIWEGRGYSDPSFYGIPVYGEMAVKVGQDQGGKDNPVDPDTRSFDPDLHARSRTEAFLRAHIPGALGPLLYTKTCLYTLTPDGDFVIDCLPSHPNIAVAVCAGHAYKWCSLIGMWLAQLVATNTNPLNSGCSANGNKNCRGIAYHDLSPFRITRPALGLQFQDDPTRNNFRLKPTPASKL